MNEVCPTSADSDLLFAASVDETGFFNECEKDSHEKHKNAQEGFDVQAIAQSAVASGPTLIKYFFTWSFADPKLISNPVSVLDDFK
jgi:hypothetical protein